MSFSPLPPRRILGALGFACLFAAPIVVEHVLLRDLWSRQSSERSAGAVDTQANYLEARLTTRFDRLLHRVAELASEDAVTSVTGALPDADPVAHARWKQAAHRSLADVVRFIEPGASAWVVGPEGAIWASSLDEAASALAADKRLGAGLETVDRPVLRGRVEADRKGYLELAAPLKTQSSLVGKVAWVVLRVPAEPADLWLSDAVRSLRNGAFALVVDASGRSVLDSRGVSVGSVLPRAGAEDLARLDRERTLGEGAESVLHESKSAAIFAKALLDSDANDTSARARAIPGANLELLFAGAESIGSEIGRADQIALALAAIIGVTAFLFAYARMRPGEWQTRASVGLPALAGFAVFFIVGGATYYVMNALDVRGRDLTAKFSRHVEAALVRDLDAALELRAAYFSELDDRLAAATDLRSEFQNVAILANEAFPEGLLVLTIDDGTAKAQTIPARLGEAFDASVARAKLAPGESALARPEIHYAAKTRAGARLVFDAPFRRRDGVPARLLWQVDPAKLLAGLFDGARTSGFDVSLVSWADPSHAIYPEGSAVDADTFGERTFPFPKEGGEMHRLALRPRVDMFGTQTNRSVVFIFGVLIAIGGGLATAWITGSLVNYRLASRIDPLTGLRNRMDLDETLARELERARRHGRSLSLVVVDLDHFKRVNDQFKHAAGDDLLRAVARELERTVRKTDAVFRYGGEEFAIVLPETTNEAARVVIERVRDRFARAALRGLERLGIVTFSAGVATWDRDESADSLVDRADAAMYEAKNSGRNRVVAARAHRRGTRPATVGREAAEAAEAAEAV